MTKTFLLLTTIQVISESLLIDCRSSFGFFDLLDKKHETTKINFYNENTVP